MSLFPDEHNQRFTDAFNQAQALLEEDKMAACERAARALLRVPVPTLPCYHRIRTLCLLAEIVDDVDEAWQFHQEAKLLYYPLRRSHPQGQDSDVDKYMEELWDDITEVLKVFEEEMKKAVQEEEDEDMDSDEEAEDEDMDPDEEGEDEDMDPDEKAEDEADAKLAETDAQAQETEE